MGLARETVRASSGWRYRLALRTARRSLPLRRRQMPEPPVSWPSRGYAGRRDAMSGVRTPRHRRGQRHPIRDLPIVVHDRAIVAGIRGGPARLAGSARMRPTYDVNVGGALLALPDHDDDPRPILGGGDHGTPSGRIVGHGWPPSTPFRLYLRQSPRNNTVSGCNTSAYHAPFGRKARISAGSHSSRAAPMRSRQ